MKAPFHIKIFEQCVPFSHKPGRTVLIPGMKETVTAYPAKIKDEILEVSGPVKEWTIFQDLERGKILIRGIAENGFYKREIEGSLPEKKAKLTFGVHKAQQIERIKERAAPEEFLPFWFALGQYYFAKNNLLDYGSLGNTLLNDVFCLDRSDLYLAWKKLFQASFSDWMVPRLKDEGYHGFDKTPMHGDDPYILLPVGMLLIQNMLVQFDGTTLKILPKLPPELHCGRMTGLDIPGLGVLSIEWSKKEIKKIILEPSNTLDLNLEFSQKIQSYRIRTKCCNSRQTIENTLKIEKNQVIYFDRFQH